LKIQMFNISMIQKRLWTPTFLRLIYEFQQYGLWVGW
jgi:hypothetical protein